MQATTSFLSDYLYKRAQENDLDISASLFRRASGLLPEEICNFARVERLMPLAKKAITASWKAGGTFCKTSLWVADELTCAKGRMDRTWWSPTGGLYLVLSLSPELLPRHWAFYNLSVGVAIADAIAAIMPCEDMRKAVNIRWVNDVLIGEKKSAGILTEVLSFSEDERYLLFGIGVNVEAEVFPVFLPDATSLTLAGADSVTTKSLLPIVVANILLEWAKLHEWEAENLIEGLSAYSELSPSIAGFKRYHKGSGRECRYGLDADLTPEFDATILDICADGSLMLQKNSELITVNTGEVRYLPNTS